ncbi:MAG: hypothetical protein COT25_02415 [Candidatus Kerfeldbacteria bacterium CG08_land_8_20_14_0_20_42_7]|uniref:Peptidase M23 domain-containing protein n=1 Tax=Candidatus Kerfeldbacteria bacterium CG08_land_8_20_14_0_20_42_7 TaxID=2014245 RepID=A0A2H0YSZ7_9BACT|nr:MAG: hypothetical protein COT25_02415 [Candidatus Kerfeldbacteria bacterium CG08_land_8_20_14_0_20_42_7]
MKKRLIFTSLPLIALVIAAFFFSTNKAHAPQDQMRENNNNPSFASIASSAELAGKHLSAERCSGMDISQLTHLPMNMADFESIIPYGFTIGSHVTPIDHQYFSPKDYNSKIDTYDVYAMADSRIVAISTRDRTAKDGTPFKDYRIVFTISCRLLYYYDLVTSLAPDLQVAYERDGNNINFEVKSGQLIGRIGEQTLDFAVWDTTKPLKGFIIPEHYLAEEWKLYTADPLDYYSDDIKTQALSKYLRTVEPRSGKIDYDIDGKLIGTWFQEGTNAYAGVSGEAGMNYWVGHLSFVPDYLDPNGFQISIGNWPEGAEQFAVRGNHPDPVTVDVDTGLVKYTLAHVQYKIGDDYWNRMALVSPITFIPEDSALGCALAELTDTRTLRFEAIPNTPCVQVIGFSDNALTYTR